MTKQPSVVAPLRTHDHAPQMSGAEQTAKWGAVVSVRFERHLLEQLDHLVKQRQGKAAAASKTSWGGGSGTWYEDSAPELEALKKVLNVTWLRSSRAINRSSILQDLVLMAAGLRKLAELPKAKKKKSIGRRKRHTAGSRKSARKVKR